MVKAARIITITGASQNPGGERFKLLWRYPRNRSRVLMREPSELWQFALYRECRSVEGCPRARISRLDHFNLGVNRRPGSPAYDFAHDTHCPFL